jgi:LuxR family transcriptional regulator, maltose regulon positive regulatory protein
MAGMESPEKSANPLAEAGVALAGGRWVKARDLYECALAVEETAEALEGFAVASWWEDDVAAAIEARERAYEMRIERGDTAEAARLAGFLAWDYSVQRGSQAVANGWLRRARRLAGELEASAEHAWLPLIEASFHLDTDAKAVLRLSTEAAEHAHAHGGFDMEMTARTLQGLAMVSLGQVKEGAHLLDEGTTAATAGELHDPIAIGSCCCNMIIACERTCDYDRAGQWCERLVAFCERTGQRPLLAVCRAHNGTVLTMRGEWDEAEAELEWASGQLSTLRPAMAGYARARFADLRRRQGREGDARKLLARADGHVLAPLVHAALTLDEGDAAGAAGHAERFLAAFRDERPIETAPGLELLARARSALGDLDAAREAHRKLATIAMAVGTKHVRAAERAAVAAIAAAGDDWGTARLALEDAVDLYRSSPAPFEAARALLELARALDALERPEQALEYALRAADTFETLGTAREAARAGKLVAALGGRSTALKRAGLTAREMEVLSLVAEGLPNRQIAERLVVSEHTVHRHLANVYAKLGVSSRAAAVALVTQRDLL